MKKVYLFIFFALNLISFKALAEEDIKSIKLNTKIETDNFVIIYNQDLANVAYTLANNIEKWGQEVYAFHGAKPRVKIYVFLTNNVDFVNAYSINNRINLWLNTSLELTELHKVSNTWLESVFKHELTHNVNQLYNHGLLYIYFFPYLERLFAPTWLEEGTATYNETKLSPNGRAYDEFFYARHRFDFARGKFNYFYYKTASPYTDGAAFISYYNDTFGHEKAKNALKSYMEPGPLFIFNFMVSSPISSYAKAAGLTNKELYTNYYQFLTTKYAIADKNYTEGELLFKNRYSDEYQVKKILSIEDNVIYFLANEKTVPLSTKQNSGVYGFDLINNTNNTFVTINKNVLNANKNNNELYYNAINYKNINGTIFSTSYYYNNNSLIASTTKLKEQRAINTIATKQGLFHVVRVNNKQQLVFVANNSSNSNHEVIIPADDNFSFGDFSYDESSNSLFFNASTPESNKSYIYRYNLNNHRLYKIIEGYEPFITNNQLFFSYSLQQERYNIYRLNLVNNKVYQLTDTKFGAFNPQFYNGVLYYTSFYQNSNGIYKLPQNNFLNKDVTNKITPLNTNLTKLIVVTKSNKPTKNAATTQPFNTPLLNPNYKAKKLSWFDYKLEAFMGVSTENDTVTNNLGISLVALDASNTLSFALSSIDYSNLYKDASDKAILSPTLTFIYHPNEIDTSLNLFEFTSFYNKKYGGFIANFNPIIFNGYGNLPTVYLNSKINHRADYLAGATLDFSKQNLKLAAGYETTYKNTSNLSYYSANFNNNLLISYYIGYKDLDYSIAVRNNIDQTWHAKDTNYVLKATLQREIVFDDIYWGRKDGLLGINTFTTTPFVTYFLSNKNGKANTNTPNNYQSTYFGLDNYFNVRLFNVNLDLGLNVMYRFNLKSYNPQQYNNVAQGFDTKKDISLNLIVNFSL